VRKRAVAFRSKAEFSISSEAPGPYFVVLLFHANETCGNGDGGGTESFKKEF